MSRELLASLNVGLSIEPYNDVLLALSVDQHRALVAAVAAGDADTAAAVAREHFTITTDALRRAADRAGGQA
jgi:DNA-binding GntR family transcriptional regulator